MYIFFPSVPYIGDGDALTIGNTILKDSINVYTGFAERNTKERYRTECNHSFVHLVYEESIFLEMSVCVYLQWWESGLVSDEIGYHLDLSNWKPSWFASCHGHDTFTLLHVSFALCIFVILSEWALCCFALFKLALEVLRILCLFWWRHVW